MALANKKDIEGLAGKFERRWIPNDSALKPHKRADSEEEEPMICGHASVFNQSADLGYFVERVAPGAFTKTIQADDVRALFNHDPSLVIGRSNRNLRMSEDSVGLYFEVDMPNTSVSRDLQENIRTGLISQCSIGFYARGAELSKQDGVWTRTLTEIQLFDVSPVTYPAFPTTDVSMRSLHLFGTEFRTGPETDDLDPLAWLGQFEERRRRLLLAEL